MWRIRWTVLAVLLVTSVAIVGACGPGGEAPLPPPVPTYETPPLEEALAVGESFESDEIKFTFTEYILMPEIRGYPPLESGNQYLLMHYRSENMTNEPLAPPYLETTMVLLYQNQAKAIPSLIFKPDVPLPDGSSAIRYRYRTQFSGKLGGGETKDGWECYLIPLEFSPAETYLRVAFEPTGYVFWNLSK